MAACTHRVSTASTANASTYASGAFTPALNDLLVAEVEYSATTVGVVPTMTDSQGLGFTLIVAKANDNTSGATAIFVANALAANSSMTVTLSPVSTTPTGAIITVTSVSGMTKTGATAAKQSASANGVTSAPAATFASSVLTGNVTITVVQGVGSGTGLGVTQPTSWTSQNDTGYSTPTIGGQYATRDSGFTGTTITWGSSLSGRWSTAIIELDTSASGTDATVTGVAAASPASAPVPVPLTSLAPATVAAPASVPGPTATVMLAPSAVSAPASASVPSVTYSGSVTAVTASAPASAPVPVVSTVTPVVVTVPTASCTATARFPDQAGSVLRLDPATEATELLTAAGEDTLLLVPAEH